MQEKSSNKNFNDLIIDLNTIYSYLPLYFKKIISSSFEPIINRVLQLYQYKKIKIYELQGFEKNSKQKIITFFLGNDITCNYISNVIYQAEPEIRSIGFIKISEIKDFLKEKSKKADLIIVNTDVFYKKYLENNNMLIIPEWVSFIIDTSRSMNEIEKDFSRGAHGDLRRIKKYNYSYIVTREPKHLNYFYEHMFLPYIKEKYGDVVTTTYYSYIQSILERTELLLIKYQDNYICGGLIERKGDTMFLPSMGVVDGNIDYIKQGVSIALMYYHIEYAHDQGFKILNHGDSRAFLKDGVTQFKKKWGMQALYSKYFYGCFGIKVCNHSKSVESFLNNNPFIHYQNNRLKGLIYVNHDKAVEMKDIKHLFRSLYTTGLDELSIITPNGFTEDAKKYDPNGFKIKLSNSTFYGKKTEKITFIKNKKEKHMIN